MAWSSLGTLSATLMLRSVRQQNESVSGFGDRTGRARREYIIVLARCASTHLMQGLYTKSVGGVLGLTGACAMPGRPYTRSCASTLPAALSTSSMLSPTMYCCKQGEDAKSTPSHDPVSSACLDSPPYPAAQRAWTKYAATQGYHVWPLVMFRGDSSNKIITL